MAVVVGAPNVGPAAPSPGESSSSGEARRKVTGWKNLEPSAGPEWPLPRPNSKEPAHFLRTDPTFENGLLVISQSLIPNSAPSYILPQTSVPEHMRCPTAATIGFGMPAMEMHWPKLRIIHEATREEYRVLPPYLYTIPIGKNGTPQKCDACNRSNLGGECFVFAFTGPAPSGKYPRINSEGDPEEIMMYSCYHCVIAGRRCDFLGVVIWGDRAMLHKRTQGYAAEEEDKFLRQPLLEELITLPNGFRFDMPRPNNKSIQPKHNTRPPPPAPSAAAESNAGSSRASTPSRLASGTEAKLPQGRNGRHSQPTFHASYRLPPQSAKRAREDAPATLVLHTPSVQKRPRAIAPGTERETAATSTPISANGVAQNTTTRDRSTTRVVLPPTPLTSTRTSPPRHVASVSIAPPTPLSDTSSEHSDMLLVLAEEAERESSPVVSDRRQAVTHETSFARRSPESLVGKLRAESEESEDEDDDWDDDDDAGSVVGQGSAPKARQDAPAVSTGAGHRIGRGRSVSSAAARARTAQALQPGWRDAGMRDILEYGNTTSETLSRQLARSDARSVLLERQLCVKTAEIAELGQRVTLAEEAQTKLEGDLAVKTQEHASALSAILQVNDKFKSQEMRSEDLAEDVQKAQADVTRLREAAVRRDAEIGAKEKEVKDLKGTVAARDSELARQRTEIRSRTTEISRLMSEGTKFFAKFDEQSSALREAATKAEADAKKIQKLERRAKERDDEVAALKYAARSRDAQLDDLRKANSRHVMSLWRAGHEKKTLHEQMDAAAVESKTALGARDATITRLEGEVSSRDLMIRGGTDKQTELRGLLVESRGSNAASEASLARLKLELKGQVEQLAERQSTIDALRADIAQRDQTISGLQDVADKAKADAEVERANARTAHAAELLKVKQEADAAERKVAALEAEVVSGKEDLRGSMKAIEALQNDLGETQRAASEAEIKVGVQARDITRLEKALREEKGTREGAAKVHAKKLADLETARQKVGGEHDRKVKQLEGKLGEARRAGEVDGRKIKAGVLELEKAGKALESAQNEHAARETKLGAELESARATAKERGEELDALKKASSEARATLSRVQEELGTTQTKLRTAEARVREVEGELGDARASVERLVGVERKQTESLTALQTELAARKGDLAAVEADRDALRAAKTGLEHEVATARKAATDAEAVSNGLRTDLEARDTALKASADRVSVLEGEKESLVARVEQLGVDLSTAKTTAERLSSEAAEKDAAISSHAETIQTAQADVLRLTVEEAAAREDYAKQDTELTAARAAISRLEKVETSLGHTVAARDATIAAAQQSNEQLSVQVEQLHTTIAERDDALTNAAQTATRLEGDVTGLNERVLELGSAVKAGEQDVARLEGEKKAGQTLLEQSGKELEGVRKEVSALKEREAGLEQQVSDRTAECDKAVGERDEAREGLKGARDAAKEAADAHAAVVAGWEEKIGVAVTETQRVQIERDALKKRCDESAGALRRAETEHAEMRSKLAEVQQSASDAAVAAVKAQSEVEADRDELRSGLSKTEDAARTAGEQHAAAVQALKDSAQTQATESAGEIQRAREAQRQAEQTLAEARSAAAGAAQDHRNAMSEVQATHIKAAKAAAEELRAARIEAQGLRSQVDAKRRALRTARESIATMEREAEQNKSHEEAAALEAQRAVDAVVEARRKAEKDLSLAQKSHSVALEDLQRRMRATEDALGALQEELRESNRRASASDTEIAALNEDAKRAEAARAQLQTELEEERARCGRLRDEAEEQGVLVDKQLDLSERLFSENQAMRAMLGLEEAGALGE